MALFSTTFHATNQFFHARIFHTQTKRSQRKTRTMTNDSDVLSRLQATLEKMTLERDADPAIIAEFQANLARIIALIAERDASNARTIALNADIIALNAERDAANARNIVLRKEREDALELAFHSIMPTVCSTVTCPSRCPGEWCGCQELRGYQLAQKIADFIGALFPHVSDSDVAVAWHCFSQKVDDSWRAPPADTAHQNEILHVRDVVRWMLDAAMPNTNSRDLRLFYNVPFNDDMKKAMAMPDFSFTHARDAQSSLLGSVFMVEVKLPNEMESAEYQSQDYARRRVFKLFEEARSRGEAGDTVRSIVACTDGREMTFSSVLSGAPQQGGSFAGLMPCPTTCSSRLPLLPGWNGISRPELPAVPPPGFEALVRVLRAPVDFLACNGAPLSSLRARWSPNDGGVPAAMPLVDEELLLGMCLGRGGKSDVFFAVGRADTVIKVGRSTSAALVESYKAETRALLTLHNTAGRRGLVPVLVRCGERVMSTSSAHSCPWPLLELSPAGVPLEQWLRDPAHDAMDMYETADSVVSRVVAALTLAHELNIVHCDVRPANVIIANGKAVLVDWGVSRDVGTDCAGVGVMAYGVDGVCLANTYAASISQDLVAAAFLWLSIALGRGRAPWVRAPCSVVTTVEARAKWMWQSDRVIGNSERVARVVAFIIGHCQDDSNEASHPAVTAAAASLWPPQPSFAEPSS